MADRLNQLVPVCVLEGFQTVAARNLRPFAVVQPVAYFHQSLGKDLSLGCFKFSKWAKHASSVENRLKISMIDGCVLLGFSL
jgi:hypothetical protein